MHITTVQVEPQCMKAPSLDHSIKQSRNESGGESFGTYSPVTVSDTSLNKT